VTVDGGGSGPDGDDGAVRNVGGWVIVEDLDEGDGVNWARLSPTEDSVGGVYSR